MKAKLNIKEYKIDYLLKHLADYNPRKINEEERAGLQASIEKFGYIENIVFNKRTETLVSGHQRVSILADLGYKNVDGHEIDVPVEVEKQINVTANNQNITGFFTTELQELLDEIVENDPELFDLTGMGRLSINDLVDEEPEKKEKPKANNSIPEMDLMPYEHYDCVVVVFKKLDNFLFMKDKLGLDEKRIISAPMVKNKKIGTVRAIEGSKLVDLIEPKIEL